MFVVAVVATVAAELLELPAVLATVVVLIAALLMPFLGPRRPE